MVRNPATIANVLNQSTRPADGGSPRFSVRGHAAALLITAVLGVLLSSEARAQASGEDGLRERVQRWVDAEWEAAQALEAIDGFSILWRIEDRYVPSRSEMARLEAEIGNKPDHPERYKLDIYRRRFQQGPDIERYELWIRGWNAWRINHTFADGTYWDHTWTPNRAWSLSSRALVVSDPRLDASATEPIITTRTSYMPNVTLLLHGGLGLARFMQLTAREPVELAGLQWSFVASAGPPVPEDQRLRVRFAGRWDEGLERGFVESVEVVRSPTSTPSRWRIDEWTYDEGIARHVATRIHYTAPGFDRLIVYEGSEPDPPGGFRALTAVPTPGKEDVVRGRVDPPHVRDLRTGEVRVRDAVSGEVVTRREPAASDRVDSEGSLWRWIGIVLLGLVITLVILAARQRRRRLAGAIR